jgi:predicted transcriptional regulator with HTH domain
MDWHYMVDRNFASIRIFLDLVAVTTRDDFKQFKLKQYGSRMSSLGPEFTDFEETPT